jgi:diguanylate cyclase (GGDEF)-like protein
MLYKLASGFGVSGVGEGAKGMVQPSTNDQILPANLWELFIATSSDGFILLDADWRVAMVNPAAVRLIGDGFIGAHISNVLPPAATDTDGTAHIQLGHTAFTTQRTVIGHQHVILRIRVVSHAMAVMQTVHHDQKLYDLLMIISSALDMPTILERMARLTMELIGADASSIPLYDAQRDIISSGLVINLPETSITAPFTRGRGLIWDVIDSQTPIIINNYQIEARAMPSLISAGVSAIIAVPIPGIDRTIFGVLTLYRLESHKGFTRHDLDALVIIGRQTGIALQNARLYKEAIHESKRRHLLYAASVEIGAALDLENLYLAIHRAASRMMICDSFSIALYDEERHEIAYVYIVDHQGRWPARRVPFGRGLLGHIISTDVSLRLSNSEPEIEAIFGAERLHSDADVTRSILATVMHTGKQIVGAITVQAHDPYAYTSKDLDALEMLASTAAIATQNAHFFARIQKMATIDPLTQIPNRRHFFEVASDEIERTDRYKRPVSLIIFDIDSFKAVNDTYGHLAGDQVLKAVAIRCRDDLRDMDTVSRYGGEEFVVLLPETSYADALHVAQRLRICIGDLPVQSDAGPITVTISVGVDSCDETFAGSLENLLDRADQALYVAKNSGRNQVVGFRSLIFERNGAHHPSAELKNDTSRS